MTISTYIICFFAAVLGMVFHIFAVKIPGIQTRASVANVDFNYSQYFKDDLTAIIASFVTILIWLLVIKELVAYKPDIQGWLIALSVLIGFTGSSVLLAALGKAQSKLNTIVDVKTDIADSVAPPAPPTKTV